MNNSKSTFIVASNGTGLYCREILDNDTTVYCDDEVAGFDNYPDAEKYMNENDHKFYIWED